MAVSRDGLHNHDNVTQFVVSATRLISTLREDFDLNSADEVLIEGVLHCVVNELLQRQERRETVH